jgi:hypothetical protein
MAGAETREDDMTTDPSFTTMYETLTLTAEALKTHPEDPELARLARWLGGALADWEAIEAAGLGLKKLSLQAAAHVRVADALLDHALGAFATALLDHLKGDTRSALYQRLFPEPHQDVIDLGLDAELPVAAHIVAALEHDEALAALKEHRAALGAVVALGTRALTTRADALANLGRHTARMQGWLESAGSMQAIVARTVTRVAEERKLSPRWARAFA